MKVNNIIKLISFRRNYNVLSKIKKRCHLIVKINNDTIPSMWEPTAI